MAKDPQKTDDQVFSNRMMWVAFGALASPLIILLIVFLVLDWPFGASEGDGTTWFVAAAVIVLLSVEKVWPTVKAKLLAWGLPPWVFGDDWRGAAVLAAGLSVIMLSAAALTNEEGTWFTKLGTFWALLAGFAFWFTWFFVIPTAWRWWRNKD